MDRPRLASGIFEWTWVRTNLSGLVDGAVAPGHHGYPRAADLLTVEASARASQITRLQLRRVTLFPLSSFRLANLGRKPLRSGFRGDCWLVWLVLCATVKHCPSDSGELVGKSYGQNIFV